MERLVLISCDSCQYRYGTARQGEMRNNMSAVQNRILAFHSFHFSVHIRVISQPTLTKVMIAIQEDHTQNLLFGCEFFFFIYASQFTNSPVAERNNVYDVYVYCLGIGL